MQRITWWGHHTEKLVLEGGVTPHNIYRKGLAMPLCGSILQAGTCKILIVALIRALLGFRIQV